jgi:hypothetical protein
MWQYRVESAGTLDDCETFFALHEAEDAAQRRARQTGRLQLIWARGAAMYVARIRPEPGYSWSLPTAAGWR